MSLETKNVPTSAATLTGTVETGTPSKMASTSTNEFTTPGGTGQRFRVEEFLEHGVENARTLRYLKSILHQDGRTIRAEIEAARKDGVPIVSDCQRGYWITDNLSEITMFCRSMRRRAAQIRLVAMCVERGVKDHRNS